MRDRHPEQAAGTPSWTVAQILDFARTTPRLGIKADSAIRSRLHMSRTRYAQILVKITNPREGYLEVALRTDPITTHRIIDHFTKAAEKRRKHTRKDNPS